MVPRPKPPRPPVAPARRARAGSPQPAERDHAATPVIHAVDWINERTSLSGGARWLLFPKVPKGTNWLYTLGSATLFAFLSQAVTGVFLAMYYRPSANEAYESVRHITNDVGGAEFGVATLSRFYALHMLLLPGAIATLIGAHLYLVARHGTTAPPWLHAEGEAAGQRT